MKTLSKKYNFLDSEKRNIESWKENKIYEYDSNIDKKYS